MIVTHDQLAAFRGAVVMADGCFDPLHAGHLEHFRAAASLGPPLLVNVQSDAYIASAKSRANLLPEEHRAMLLDSLDPVSFVHLCRTSTEDVLLRSRPAFYVKGSDWEGGLPAEQERICREHGIEIVFLDRPSTSSTEIVSGFARRHGRLRERPLAAPPLPGRASDVRSPYVAVATSHLDPCLSGVARFNRMLADRLGVPCVGLAEAGRAREGALLLSVKLTDCDGGERREAAGLARKLHGAGTGFDVFLHAYAGLAEEDMLVSLAARTYAGNAQIAEVVAPLAPGTSTLWCPELLDPRSGLSDHDLDVFSFGMAHKLQAARYERLRCVLDASGADYSLMVSTAFHEKAVFGETADVERRFRELFGSRVQLLGFLSDAAVGFFLKRAHLLAAFFPSGVRANNTTVQAAMACGRAVVTNLDRHSPEWMRHGENVLDVERTRSRDLDPARLDALGARARRDAAAHAGWERLVEILADAVSRSEGLVAR